MSVLGFWWLQGSQATVVTAEQMGGATQGLQSVLVMERRHIEEAKTMAVRQLRERDEVMSRMIGSGRFLDNLRAMCDEAEVRGGRKERKRRAL